MLKKIVGILIGMLMITTILPSIAISEIWLAVVPLAAPKYNIFDFCVIGKILQPFSIKAASLLREGFQMRYSVLSIVNKVSP